VTHGKKKTWHFQAVSSSAHKTTLFLVMDDEQLGFVAAEVSGSLSADPRYPHRGVSQSHHPPIKAASTIPVRPHHQEPGGHVPPLLRLTASCSETEGNQ